MTKTMNDIINESPHMRELTDATIQAVRLLVEDGEFRVEMGEEELTLALLDTAVFVLRGDDFLGVLTYQDGRPLAYLAPPFDSQPDAVSVYGLELAQVLYPYAALLLDAAQRAELPTTRDDPEAAYNDVPAGNRVWRVLGAAFPQIGDWMPERYRTPDQEDILHRRILVEMDKHTSGWDTEEMENRMDSWKSAEDPTAKNRIGE